MTPLDTGIMRGLKGLKGLFSAYFALKLACVQLIHEGLKRCDPFTVPNTRQQIHSKGQNKLVVEGIDNSKSV